MRLWIFLVLIIALPISYASIEITSELRDEYSLGDGIPFSLKIVSDEDADALVKLTLKCTDNEIPYYIAPVSLVMGEETSVDAPLIKALSEGLCSVRANVESLEGGSLEGIVSEDFVVTDRLELLFTVDKSDVLPGDKIEVEGTVSKQGESLEEGSIEISLDEGVIEIELGGGSFSYDLELREDIKSGEHTLSVEVRDAYGNFDSDSIVIEVEAVPTSLVVDVNKEEFMPKETLVINVGLLDQANDSMDEEVHLSFSKKEFLGDDVVFEEDINNEYEYVIPYDMPPDDYIVGASFGSLDDEREIEILPNYEIEMKLEGDKVFIKNIGNVKYNNKTTIMLEKEDQTYIIDKKIKLDVGEEMELDLSKEVGSGTYTVTLPAETVVEEKVVEKIVEKEVTKYIERESDEEEVEVGEAEEKAVVKGEKIENVEIEDNRPFFKKGLSFITGGVIAGAGLLVDNPNFASFLMIIIILSLIVYFGRGRIRRTVEKIRRKREESHSDSSEEKIYRN